jgi:hypothetical protein
VVVLGLRWLQKEGHVLSVSVHRCFRKHHNGPPLQDVARFDLFEGVCPVGIGFESKGAYVASI